MEYSPTLPMTHLCPNHCFFSINEARSWKFVHGDRISYFLCHKITSFLDERIISITRRLSVRV